MLKDIKSKLSNLSSSGVLHASAIALFVKVIAAGGAFLLNIVIARTLGAEQAGYFFLAQTIIVIVAIISRQGFDNVLVRFIAGYSIEKQSLLVAGIYRHVLIRILFTLMITCSLVFLLKDFISVYVFSKSELSPLMTLAAFAIAPLAICQMHSYCLQGEKRIVPAMLFESAGITIVFLLSVLFFKPIDSLGAMFYYSLAVLIVCVISTITWLKGRMYNFPKLCKTESNSINRASRPLFIVLLCSLITSWLGQLMLGVWNSSVDVALYSAAQRTAMLTSFILIAVNAIAAPKFAEAHKLNDFKEIRAISKSTSLIMSIVVMPVFIFMMVFSEQLMMLFGDEFIDGANILRILAVGQFVNVMTGSVGYLLQMTGNEKIMRNIVIISSIIMLVGSVVLIPIYGVIGAAIITAVSLSTQNLLCVYQVYKVLGFNTLIFWRKQRCQ